MRVGYITGIDQTVQTRIEGYLFQVGEGNRANKFVGIIDHDKGAVGQPAEHAFDFGDRGALGYLVEILGQNILYSQGLQQMTGSAAAQVQAPVFQLPVEETAALNLLHDHRRN